MKNGHLTEAELEKTGKIWVKMGWGRCCLKDVVISVQNTLLSESIVQALCGRTGMR